MLLLHFWCITAGLACPVMNVLLEQKVEQGCSPVLTNNEGNTAWHTDSELQQLSCVVTWPAGSACPVMDVLLEQGGEQGCSRAPTDNAGNTAWHPAAEGGHLEAVQRLLQAGSQLESTNAAECTALHIAARSGTLQT